MRSLLLICVLAACGAGDDTTDGTRSLCSRGGVLESCPPIAHTSEAACTKLVQCGAIPEQSADTNRFDWDRCVDYINRQETTSENLVIECVAASTCDLLRGNDPNNPDASKMPCLKLGGR